MSLSKSVLDSWDDDWVVSQPENPDTSELDEHKQRPNKSERRRQQFELNKKLWQEAEAPDVPYLVQKSNEVPLQSGYTPNVKVLSRRPPPVNQSRRDAKTPLRQGALEDQDEEIMESKGKELSPEERAEKLRKELEEKQKKYDEARQKIFGSVLNPTSSGSSGGNSGRGRGFGNTGSLPVEKQRGRGRGGPSGRGSPSRQLFDPHAPKGGSTPSSGRNTPTDGSHYKFSRGQGSDGPDGQDT